jgi:hypothetical protein
LLEEERDAGRRALVADRADPRGVHRPAPRAALAAHDDPADAGQADRPQVLQERLERQEPVRDRPGTDTPGTRGRRREGARRGAGRGRVASRPIRRRGGDGARAGRGRRRNGRAHAQPEGGRPFSPPSLPFGNFSRRPSPPTCPWGRRPPRGGQDARPIRPGMGPGRRQAPRRPHDAGRPTGAVAGIRGRRRPARGGRPELGDGGPSREGPGRPGWGVARGSGSVCPRQRLEAPACVEIGLALSNGQPPTALRAAFFRAERAADERHEGVSRIPGVRAGHETLIVRRVRETRIGLPGRLSRRCPAGVI